MGQIYICMHSHVHMTITLTFNEYIIFIKKHLNVHTYKRQKKTKQTLTLLLNNKLTEQTGSYFQMSVR